MRWPAALMHMRPLLTGLKSESFGSVRADHRRPPAMQRGMRLARAWPSQAAGGPLPTGAPSEPANPLAQYFNAHTLGAGIHKWTHYFDIYHRHFQRFIDQEVHVLEIGVASGGSLAMWKAYFGPHCWVYGIDVQEACKAYEDARTRVFIGDQVDRAFWRSFRRAVPRVDILIDDGGHTPEQQVVTLEEMLPYLPPGAVYLCEDIHEIRNRFAAYIYGLSDALNGFELRPGTELASSTSPFQQAIASVHLYPFVAVIEKTMSPPAEWIAPRHGTEWQPFG